MKPGRKSIFNPHRIVFHPEGMPDGSRWSFRGSRENDHRLTGSEAGCTGSSPQLSGGRSREKSERPPATFCQPFGLSTEVLCKRHSPQRDCAALRQFSRNPFGVGIMCRSLPRVARKLATLGFEAESLWDSGSRGWAKQLLRDPLSETLSNFLFIGSNSLGQSARQSGKLNSRQSFRQSFRQR
jgi:hypothetical protein